MDKDGLISILVDEKFGAKTYKLLKLNGASGVRTLADQLEIDNKDFSKVRAFIDSLKGYEVKNLRAMIRLEIEKRQRAEDAERPFSDLDAKADFEHWAKAAYWTKEEAVALSFGLEPEVATLKKMESIKAISPFARDYLKRTTLIDRQIAVGQLWQKTSPSIFLTWCKTNQIDFPTELETQVQLFGTSIVNWAEIAKSLREYIESKDEQIKEGNDKLEEVIALFDESKDEFEKLGSEPNSPTY